MSRGLTHESTANKSIEWYTPPHIFEKLGLQFDLDPCHPAEKLSWVPAAKTYSLPANGLDLPWEGRVWLNPPYGRFTPNWLRKMHEHRNGVALVFARTDCDWFHAYVAEADAILFLKGRVKFVDGSTLTEGGTPGSGSMLVAWGESNVSALRKMHDSGKFISLNKGA